jgi:hypothetical protein
LVVVHRTMAVSSWADSDLGNFSNMPAPAGCRYFG